jgi:glutathione peroxidase
MKIKMIFFALLLAFTAQSKAQNSVYDFEVKDADGKMVSLNAYKGKVLLIVNTATKCGFTPQYKALQALYEKYSDAGFVILDFPCNQFGAQAPGTIEEIHQFCTDHYSVTFPQFDKIEVNGKDASPLYQYLKRVQMYNGFDMTDPEQRKTYDALPNKSEVKSTLDIRWNFTKFLIDRDGRVVKRFEPKEKIDDIEQAVKNLLKK